MVPFGDPAQARIRVPRASARPIQGLVCGEKALVRACAFTCGEWGSSAEVSKRWTRGSSAQLSYQEPVPPAPQAKSLPCSECLVATIPLSHKKTKTCSCRGAIEPKMDTEGQGHSKLVEGEGNMHTSSLATCVSLALRKTWVDLCWLKVCTVQ